jgi:hypothetical protein
MSARPFLDLLREHRSGITHELLTDALQELVEAVVDQRKRGKLTLTLTIKPFGKKDGLEVGAEVKLTKPKEVQGVSIFYVTPENNLVRQDPRQQAMELREIPTEAHRGIA